MFGKSDRERSLDTREASLDDRKKKLDLAEENLKAEQRTLSLDKKGFEVEKGQAYKTMELDFKGKLMDETEKIRKEHDDKLRKELATNFDKLKDSLTNLHEEGNANTKYLEKITLKMMGSMAPQLTDSRES